MNPFLTTAALAAALIAGGCASNEKSGAPVPSAGPVAAAPSTAGSSPTASAPAESGPSFKETARLDRELGEKVIPYPFTNCAVIQRPFGPEGAKHRRVYKGHEVLFCCTPCVRAFDTNPEPYMPRIIAAAKEQAAGTVTPPVVAGTGR
jgi:YHS domain-containing protein